MAYNIKCKQLFLFEIQGGRIMKFRMKRLLTFDAVCLGMLFLFITGVRGNAKTIGDSNTVLNTGGMPDSDISFVRSSKVSVMQEKDNDYCILIQGKSPNLDNQGCLDVDTLMVFPSSNLEKQEILDKINQVKQASGGSIYNSSWFLGNSCYMYEKVTYATKKIHSISYYKMTKIQTKYSVRNGTKIVGARLTAACLGTDSNGKYINKNKSYTVNSSDYSTTSVASWPYIAEQSRILGAGFTVTAKRPSGEKKSHTINANVINQ